MLGHDCDRHCNEYDFPAHFLRAIRSAQACSRS
jgi:hypothetical protein